MTRIAILAGGGQLPLAIADSVTARGDDVHVVAIEGAANAEFGGHPTTRVGLGKIKGMLSALKRNGDKVVIAGALTRPDLLRLRPDVGFIQHLPSILSLLSGGDDAVLSRVVRFFEGRGLDVIGIGDVAPELIAAEGVVAGPAASGLQADSDYGLSVLGALSDLDIGQAIVVRDGAVLAIEGVEGTDRMLARLSTPGVGNQSDAGPAGRGGVLVKAPKRGQELRIDMPAIGPQTIVRAAEAGLKGIVIEAGRTVVVEGEKVRRLAETQGVSVVGVSAPVSGHDGEGRKRLRLPPCRGVTLGRIVPNEYDRKDLLKAKLCSDRLAAYGAGEAACVVRQHVLAVSAGEGPIAMAGRLAALRQWGGLARRKRKGAAVVRDEIGGADDWRVLAEIVRQLQGSTLAGVAVLRTGRNQDPVPTAVIAAADEADLFVIELVCHEDVAA